MTGAALPARALERPGVGVIVLVAFAGFVAGEGVAPRPVIFAARAAEKAPEAEAGVGEPDRTVWIAFTGRDRVTEAGDQHVAHREVGHDPLRGAVGQDDVHARGGGPAVRDAKLHFLFARERRLPRRALAVVEAPGAGEARRHRPGQDDADPMLARREIGFATAVAVAHAEQLAAAIDAEPLDGLARPAAAVAVALQPILRGEDAVAAISRHLALEIRLVAEQAESVLDLPVDPQSVDGLLGECWPLRPGRKQERGETECYKHTHGSLQ